MMIYALPGLFKKRMNKPQRGYDWPHAWRLASKI